MREKEGERTHPPLVSSRAHTHAFQNQFESPCCDNTYQYIVYVAALQKRQFFGFVIWRHESMKGS